MKIKSSNLAIVVFSILAAVSSHGAITLSNGVTYIQNFDALASSGTSSTMPIDWVFSESGSNADAFYTAGTGSGNTGDTYSFGASSASDRALGGLRSGSLTPTLGASFVNGLTFGTLTLTIAYTGEQWRLGATGRNDRLDFQYSTNATSLTTGTWTDFNSLDFIAPQSTGSAGLLDGNSAANRLNVSSSITNLNVAENATFWIRWNDFDASGSDDGLGIDDFSITAIPEPSAALLGAFGALALLRRRR